MVELVDAAHSKCVSFGSEGSSPSFGTKFEEKNMQSQPVSTQMLNPQHFLLPETTIPEKSGGHESHRAEGVARLSEDSQGIVTVLNLTRSKT